MIQYAFSGKHPQPGPGSVWNYPPISDSRSVFTLFLSDPSSQF